MGRVRWAEGTRMTRFVIPKGGLWAGALIAVSGCGGVARREMPSSTDAGGAGVSSRGSSEAAQSGGAGGTTSAGAGGTANAGAGNTTSAGSCGSGGAKAAPTVPGESVRETEILAPLDTDDATIDAATGEELVELTRAIGAARGYALCRCALSPDAPPADVEEMFEGCAFGESAAWMVATDGRARCITERMAEVPGFDDYLRCRARFGRRSGQQEIAACWHEVACLPVPIDCTLPPGGSELENECINATICRDGTLGGPRCDSVGDCRDFSDEVDCYDYNGHDLVLCASELLSPVTMCFVGVSECAYTAEPPLCVAARQHSFQCTDGSEVGTDVVCDRVEDCPDGRDESVCFRIRE